MSSCTDYLETSLCRSQNEVLRTLTSLKGSDQGWEELGGHGVKMGHWESKDPMSSTS